MPQLPQTTSEHIPAPAHAHDPAHTTPARVHIVTPSYGRIQIAQGAEGKPLESGAAGVHAATEKGEHSGEAEPGEIPDAAMLFWNSVIVFALMIAFALFVRRSLQRTPRGAQNVAEAIVEGMNGFTTGIIGPGGKRYTPLVGTVFVFILLCNLIGLVPGLHSPTANLSITLALGVIVFCYVQYEGIRQNGLWGYVKHFAGPMPALAWLMFPVELISEIVKPFTLAVRLFGNIFGEDVILVVLAGLVLKLTGTIAFGWIPAQLPVLLLSILTAGVQALVFSMLTCIYLSLVSHHDHDGAHGEEGALTDAHAHAAH